jgi:hypothetical protein
MKRTLTLAVVVLAGVAIGAAAVTAWWAYKPKRVTR